MVQAPAGRRGQILRGPGNHDGNLTRVSYPPLNMGGRRYYTFALGNERFLVLDSSSLDPKQLESAEKTSKARARPGRSAIP